MISSNRYYKACALALAVTLAGTTAVADSGSVGGTGSSGGSAKSGSSGGRLAGPAQGFDPTHHGSQGTTDNNSNNNYINNSGASSDANGASTAQTQAEVEKGLAERGIVHDTQTAQPGNVAPAIGSSNQNANRELGQSSSSSSGSSSNSGSSTGGANSIGQPKSAASANGANGLPASAFNYNQNAPIAGANVAGSPINQEQSSSSSSSGYSSSSNR